MAIEELCAKLDALLSSRQGGDQMLEAAVNALSRIFAVNSSEVALFGLDDRLDSLHFIWPPDMRKAGSIPLNASRSLVSSTAVERRCFLDNRFSSTPHLFIFEAFSKEPPQPIQKIMSAPLMHGEELKGVIQVCRKGEDTDFNLKNFTQPELSALGALAKVIGMHL